MTHPARLAHLYLHRDALFHRIHMADDSDQLALSVEAVERVQGYIE